MTDLLMDEATPGSSISEWTGQTIDMAPDHDPVSELADLVNASWYLAFLPMIIWSQVASRALAAMLPQREWSVE